MVDDLIINTKENIKKYKIKSYEDILQLNNSIVSFSEPIVEQELKLKNFKINMYEHARELKE